MKKNQKDHTIFYNIVLLNFVKGINLFKKHKDIGILCNIRVSKLRKRGEICKTWGPSATYRCSVVQNGLGHNNMPSGFPLPIYSFVFLPIMIIALL